MYVDIEISSVDEDRKLLMRGVYLILACQMATTVIICTVAVAYPPLRSLITSPYTVIASIASTFGIFASLSFCQKRPRWNRLCLIVFTLSLAMNAANVVARSYDPTLSLAGFVTILILFSLLACMTPIVDYTFLGPWLMGATTMFVVFTLAQLVVFSSWIHVVLSWAGVVLFSTCVVYDVSNLAFAYGPHQAVEASIGLYLLHRE